MDAIPRSAAMSPPSPSEDPPSSTEQPKKREQVKNACVNCQKACKKCDSGRPCQRCIKYNLVDTCVDSVRKQRRKGIKRGPYKKRKKESDQVSSQSTPQPTPPQSAGPSSQPSRGSRVTKNKRLSRSLSTYGRHFTPRVLGPGSIPILHNDEYEESSTDETESLQSSQIASFDALSLSPPLMTAPQHQQIFIPANPPAQSSRHEPLPHTQSQTPYYQFQQTREPIRLPPIASFDQAHPVIQPPTTSSLHILTHVALSSSPPAVPARPPYALPPLPLPPQIPGPTTQPIPPHFPPPDHPDHSDPQDPRRYTQMKSSPPSPSSPDAETHIHRLSQQLGNVHIGQQSHTEDNDEHANTRAITRTLPSASSNFRAGNADATQTNDY
ncbi:hypothetical protein DL89DRAFT_267584 [Linderina pennispora]|uniref:Zn(2)-C6 fungal-type domain-containing protein n=1 Tax=Linderina pennispora TaxID=61395 RepID=A0A1Y1WA05_9FUNG|nr:uncharacterized protein DL89DRAFT_267584 [Linderina pennispora]ORX70361.1 hypothetical protein DL89DRAFT_267584 [Linderina pennispora]